jgi:hypothetical protein
MSSIGHRVFVHLGMDVSQDSMPWRSCRPIVRASPGIWARYEAGPSGHNLQAWSPR